MMEIHSISSTKKYSFDCKKNWHLKVSREKDGSLSFSCPGERNGSCSGIWANVFTDVITESLKRPLTPEKLIEICKGHSCKYAGLGYRSCVHKFAEDIGEIIKKEGE